MKKTLSRALTWCLLLQKRVLRRPAFLVILLLIPLLTAGFVLASDGDGGIYTIALIRDENDPEAVAFCDELVGSRGIFILKIMEDEELARELVERGEISYAWIFPPGFRDRLRAVIAGDTSRPPVVVVEQEEAPLHAMTRERLFTYLFPKLSFELFRARILAMEPDPVPTDEELERMYRSAVIEEDVMAFVDLEGRPASSDVVTSPLRGMLSLLILEGGLAAAVFCAGDVKNGVFLRQPRSRQRLVTLAAVTLPMLDLALAVFLSLCVSGLTADPLRDLLMLLLFVPAGAGLALLLLAVLRSSKRLGFSAMFTAVATLALCPVFLEVDSLKALSALLPATHYVRAVQAPGTAWSLVLYAAVTLAASFLFSLIPERQ
ncbi:MAG: hypothetical protein II776_00925 [Clostridia bacterium]|nr:hypothetical protein [Clostridia bacterium]